MDNMLVENATISDFQNLTNVEKLILGSKLCAMAASAYAGATTSVFVLRGIFGEGIIGRFEQLVGIIGGTVIGSVGGCIVFKVTGLVTSGYVAAFVIAALAGGISIVLTGIGMAILRGIHRIWTTFMAKTKSFRTEAVEVVQSAVAKLAGTMTSAYTTMCITLDRVEKAMGRMSKEQKAVLLPKIKTTFSKSEAKIDQTMDVLEKDLKDIFANDLPEEDIKYLTEALRTTKHNNSMVLQQKIENMMSDTTTH